MSHPYSSCDLLQPSQSNEYLLRDELGGLYVLSERSRNRGLKDIVHFVSDLAPHCPYVRRSGYRHTVYVHPVLVCVDRVEVLSHVGSGRHSYCMYMAHCQHWSILVEPQYILLGTVPL